jgi:uncharacterized membrane protein
MIGLAFVYAVAGALFAVYALLGLHDRRWANAAFWGLMATSFLAGSRFSDLGNGLLALGLVAIAGLGLMRAPDPRRDDAPARGNAIFLPMLIVPVVALVGTLATRAWPGWVDPKQATLVWLAVAVLVALAVVLLWLRPGAATPFREGLRLMDSIGWAAVLPQMLVSLGAIFALSGVGGIVGGLIGGLIPHGSLAGATIAYGLGMALFTILMGNAFAAFPVMTIAVGLPLLIHRYHGDPAIVCAIGMLCGYCGTLLTPMAANFNIVPAMLLDLKDRHGVIRAQAATALPLLVVNILLIYGLAFR